MIDEAVSGEPGMPVHPTPGRRKRMTTTRPGMKPIRSIIVLIMVVFCCRTAMAGAAPQIKTDKDIHSSGEKINVNFFDSPGNPRDWICIVAAGSPDDDAGDYQYMPRGVVQGVLTFDSPPPGKYEARAYYNYSRNGYVVSARYGFSVESGAPSAAPATATPADPLMGAGKTKPAESRVTKPVPGDSFRVSLSVFHFTPLNMGASPYGITATNTIVNALKKQTSFVVLDRKDLETFLVANDLQQNDRTENMIHIGTKMGLNFVIAGSVEYKGTMIITNCKVISIETRKEVFTNKSISMGESDLTGNMTKMSDAIREAILGNTP
jgi:TolB-like protein